MENKIQELAEMIKKAQNIVVLTGAGISTDSGISDFRSKGGIYETFGEDVVGRKLSIDFFKNNPFEFWGFYEKLFDVKMIKNLKPNETHLFFKKLEEQGKMVSIYTQNIDDLHKKAGSKYVTELHGNLNKMKCMHCGKEYEYKKEKNSIPLCEIDGNVLKPSIVLFGEDVRGVQECINESFKSDLFITLGTSLSVYPVNTIPMMIPTNMKVKKAIINRTFTNEDHHFHLKIHNNISEVTKKLSELI